MTDAWIFMEVYHHLYDAYLMTTKVNLNLMEPLDLTISV